MIFPAFFAAVFSLSIFAGSSAYSAESMIGGLTDFSNIYELSSLFLSAFLAATLLPAQSELLLAALYFTGNYPSFLLIFVATSGNVLGSVVNWILGRYLLHFKQKRWFPLSQKHLDKATSYYQKWGIWTLLLAWAPIIGDPLTLVAGIFRVNILLFLLLVTLGKAARYTAIIALL